MLGSKGKRLRELARMLVIARRVSEGILLARLSVSEGGPVYPPSLTRRAIISLDNTAMPNFKPFMFGYLLRAG